MKTKYMVLGAGVVLILLTIGRTRMYKIKHEADVRFTVPQLASRRGDIAAVFNHHTRKITQNFVPTITSGNDGKHSENSLHYKNRAEDWRIKYYENERWVRLPHLVTDVIVQDLRKVLGDDFDVVWEPTHIHIEFDPKV